MRAFAPAQELFRGNYVVSIFEKLELTSKRFRRYQIAIELRIDDFVSCGQYAVISQNCGRCLRSAAKISCFGQARINNVLQQWTDQFHTFIAIALLTRHSYKRNKLGKFLSQSARSDTISWFRSEIPARSCSDTLAARRSFAENSSDEPTRASHP